MKRFIFAALTVTATVALVAVMGLSGTAWADTIEPTSYDMQNGEATYRDDTYNGSGDNNVSLDPLTNGLGDLTDDVISAINWNTDSGVSNLPYVGWQSIHPTITFSFAEQREFDSVTVYMDHSHQGGVDLPATVEITVGSEPTQIFAVTHPAAGTPAAPVSETFNVGGEIGDTVVVKIIRLTQWIMISEIDFDGPPH